MVTEYPIIWIVIQTILLLVAIVTAIHAMTVQAGKTILITTGTI